MKSKKGQGRILPGISFQKRFVLLKQDSSRPFRSEANTLYRAKRSDLEGPVRVMASRKQKKVWMGLRGLSEGRKRRCWESENNQHEKTESEKKKDTVMWVLYGRELLRK